MKRAVISLILCAMLLTGCSNQQKEVPTEANEAQTATTVSELVVTSTAVTTTKPVYPTRTLDCVENVTITVPEYPDCPLESLHFFDSRREIENREPKEYIQSVISQFDSIMTAQNTNVTELPNQNDIRIWKIVGNARTFYAAAKHRLYYFMEWKGDAEYHIEDVLNEMQIDDSNLHYAYDPENDNNNDEAPYCYSQLSAEEKKTYDEIYQILNPLTVQEHKKWMRSNVTEAEAEQLQKIVDGINIDYEYEFSFLDRVTSFENGVFTVQAKIVIDTVPEEQVIKENLEGYRNICKKSDEIIAAMPKTLTRYGKYVYLARAVCDMTEYVNYIGNGPEPNYYWGRIRGAFEDGKTFCQGYGDAFAFLCRRAGLYCMCISGNGHKWNGIKLNNELYHFDTTWMDEGEWGYSVFYSHPFNSDEIGHQPHMKDFMIFTQYYPEWESTILKKGSIDWDTELAAPEIAGPEFLEDDFELAEEENDMF